MKSSPDKVNWLLDVDGSKDNITRLNNSILQSERLCKAVSTSDYYNERYNHFDDDACVVYYGSIQVAKAIQKLKPSWKPGPIANFTNFLCSHYYPEIGDLLFNSEYVMIPLGDLKRSWPLLQRTFGQDELFIRPDGGDKTFTGRVVEDADTFFEKEKVYLDEFCQPHDICVISAAKNIEAEYRFVVADKQVVTGSRYSYRRHPSQSAEVPDGALAVAKEVASSSFSPDIVYVVDVCESEDNFRVMETGAFSCAGLYMGDTDKIVEAVSSLVASHK